MSRPAISSIINPFMYGRFSDPYSNVLWEGVKLFFPYGHPQQKVLKGQEFSGMGCLKIFRVKGKKHSVTLDKKL